MKQPHLQPFTKKAREMKTNQRATYVACVYINPVKNAMGVSFFHYTLHISQFSLQALLKALIQTFSYNYATCMIGQNNEITGQYALF